MAFQPKFSNFTGTTSKISQGPIVFRLYACGSLFPLLHNINAKLEGWDSNLLLIAGCAELIQGIITPIVMYWLLIYHLPFSTAKKIDHICVDFFGKAKCKKSLGILYANRKWKVA